MANEVRPPHPADPDGTHDSRYARTTRAIPPGGSPGQVLKKASGTDYDAGWGYNVGLPLGGTIYQPIIKSSSIDQDARWDVVPKSIPLHRRSGNPAQGVDPIALFGPGSHGPGSAGVFLDNDYYYGRQLAVWIDAPVTGATVDQARLHIPVAQSGGVVYAYLYADDGFFPGLLIDDLGSVPTDTKGIKSISISPTIELDEGNRYWIVVETNAPSDFSFGVWVRSGTTISGHRQGTGRGDAMGAFYVDRPATPLGAIANFSDAGYPMTVIPASTFPLITLRSNRP